ncbi:NUDIX hydrolase [Paracoccus sp. PXZ]|uniref:NUDIX hydrolase n=1 Tax=Pseudochrobactrum sp. B5 TaxID=1289478 RepID=UPI000A541924|nr:NUDIX hydrolase [Pseudochrobactrum sp. B5]
MRRAYDASASLRAPETSEGPPLAEQYGALAWRKSRTKGLRVLLITSRERGLWILPKGWPMPGLSPHRTAAREALEEAGVFGTISAEPCGSYRYAKVLADGQAIACRVTIYPLLVKATLVDWRESKDRRRKWFSLPEAVGAVSEPGLAQFLQDLAQTWAGEGEPDGL